jgi:hypothetical protein
VLEQAVDEQFPEASAQLEVLDRKTYDAIQRLIAAGVLSPGEGASKILHQSPSQTERRSEERGRRLAESRKRFEEAERKQRMAGVLADGGFPVEALPPLREAVETALRSLAYLTGQDGDDAVSLGFIESRLIGENMVPPETPSLVAQLRESAGGDEDMARSLFTRGQQVLEHAAEALNRVALK